MTTIEKLARLQNRATRYEVVLSHPGYEPLLVGYTSRKSRRGLVDAIQQRGQQIVKLIDMDDDCRVVPKGQCLEFSNGWSAKFSGRTQRDSICGGELPFVLEVEAVSKKASTV